MGSTSSICFVMPTAHPTIMGGVAGGAELQSWMIARGLAGRHDVSFIVTSPSPGREVLDRVRLIRVRKSDPIRTYFWMLLALLRLRPDVIYQRTGGLVTVFCFLAARLLGSRFVFHVSSDIQFQPDYPSGSWPVRLAFRMAFRSASTRIVQNAYQKSRSPRNSVLLPNMVELSPAPATQGKSVLWIGSTAGFKRPGLFINLARSLPQYHFVMIAKPPGRGHHGSGGIAAEARKVSNLEFLGEVPLSQIWRHLQNCRLLVNTSEFEGFPNTFLDAWSRGIPVVSLGTDPDGVISRFGLGSCPATPEGLRHDVTSLMENGAAWQAASRNCLSYVRRHDSRRLLPLYERVIVGQRI